MGKGVLTVAMIMLVMVAMPKHQVKAAAGTKEESAVKPNRCRDGDENCRAFCDQACKFYCRRNGGDVDQPCFLDCLPKCPLGFMLFGN
ncbi:OLC1v1018265C1 [Oldenlandia corymbosa var. corymbosa]|uniref:OLC1v1018265C1 n=1 Tax=Oldenlandia corymbosa var. corymbosa TaxID=529605 RepID=A0AAV1EBE2_OLDCO|nr:OLC1v1018265C1 [Oldenlandia corymbosa var. corymbosa]